MFPVASTPPLSVFVGCPCCCAVGCLRYCFCLAFLPAHYRAIACMAHCQLIFFCPHLATQPPIHQAMQPPSHPLPKILCLPFPFMCPPCHAWRCSPTCHVRSRSTIKKAWVLTRWWGWGQGDRRAPVVQGDVRGSRGVHAG